MRQSTINEYSQVENTLLPIVKCSFDQSTQVFTLRLTPLNEYSYQKAKDFIESISLEYIISQENSKKDKLHFHSVIWTNLDDEQLREFIRDFIKLYSTEEEIKKKGFFK